MRLTSVSFNKLFKGKMEMIITIIFISERKIDKNKRENKDSTRKNDWFLLLLPLTIIPPPFSPLSTPPFLADDTFSTKSKKRNNDDDEASSRTNRK